MASDALMSTSSSILIFSSTDPTRSSSSWVRTFGRGRFGLRMIRPVGSAGSSVEPARSAAGPDQGGLLGGEALRPGPVRVAEDRAGGSDVVEGRAGGGGDRVGRDEPGPVARVLGLVALPRVGDGLERGVVGGLGAGAAPD